MYFAGAVLQGTAPAFWPSESGAQAGIEPAMNAD